MQISKREFIGEVILTELIAFGSRQNSTGILCKSRLIRRRTIDSILEARQQPGNCKGKPAEALNWCQWR